MHVQRYLPIPRSVEAIQVRKDSLHEVQDFTGLIAWRDPIEGETLLVEQSPYQFDRVNVGDWVVRSVYGEIIILPPAEFEAMYLPLDSAFDDGPLSIQEHKERYDALKDLLERQDSFILQQANSLNTMADAILELAKVDTGKEVA